MEVFFTLSRDYSLNFLTFWKLFFLFKSKLKSLGNVWVEIPFISENTRTICLLHNMIPLATVALQEGR